MSSMVYYGKTPARPSMSSTMAPTRHQDILPKREHRPRHSKQALGKRPRRPNASAPLRQQNNVGWARPNSMIGRDSGTATRRRRKRPVSRVSPVVGQPPGPGACPRIPLGSACLSETQPQDKRRSRTRSHGPRGTRSLLCFSIIEPPQAPG